MCSFITQHNATDDAGFEGACSWHAQGQGLDPGEDDALDWRVRQRVPIPANVQQLRTAIEEEWAFHRPQSTLCERDVSYCMRQMMVTPDTGISEKVLDFIFHFVKNGSENKSVMFIFFVQCKRNHN